MIDLEQERKAFEAEWLNLGGHLNSFQIVNKMYVLTENVQSAGPVVKELSERAINSAFALWLIQARQKNTLIVQLTADLEKAQAVPHGYMVLPKNATKEMVNAGYEAHDGFHTNGQVQDVYQAMVKASESGAEG